VPSAAPRCPLSDAGEGPPTRATHQTPPPKKGAPNHVIFGYVGGPVGSIPKILLSGSRDWCDRVKSDAALASW
jgi:hypothetical protein